MEKWNVHRPAASAENSLVVELAANTTLEMGEQVYLAGLAGAGSLNGDVTVGKLVADFAPESLETGLTVNGKFTVPNGITVELRNLPQNLEGKMWTKLVSATSFGGLENLADAVFIGESAGTGIAQLSFREDAVWCKYFTQTGLKLILK